MEWEYRAIGQALVSPILSSSEGLLRTLHDLGTPAERFFSIKRAHAGAAIPPGGWTGWEGVIPEDFGWVVMISRTPFMLWLACSNTDGSTDEWMVYPVAELSVMQRLFRRVDPAPELERLRSHLAEVVPLIPGVTNIVWE